MRERCEHEHIFPLVVEWSPEMDCLVSESSLLGEQLLVLAYACCNQVLKVVGFEIVELLQVVVVVVIEEAAVIVVGLILIISI